MVLVSSQSHPIFLFFLHLFSPRYISSSYTYPSSVYLWAEYLYSKRTDLLPPPSHQVSPTSSLSTPPSASVSTPASYKFDPFYLPLVEKAAQICRASSASSLPGYLRYVPFILFTRILSITSCESVLIERFAPQHILPSLLS